MALPYPSEDVLAYRPRHDPTQDSTWSSRNGASQDFRGHPATVRSQEAHGGTTGTQSAEAKAGTEVLHARQVGTRVRLEVQGCG